MNPAEAAPVAKASVAKKPTHPGCHGHTKATARQAPTKGKGAQAKHNSKPAGKEDCCKDKSAAILKSLTPPAEKQLLTPAPALLPAASDFYFRPAAGQWDRTNAVVLVPGEHLPPKIPDIRIFIQSLTV
ncbi:MAG TPA: hypothetical protein VF598_03045 [Hymenobacter sp.]